MKDLIKEFLKTNALAKKCKTPKGAYCMCDTVSILFMQFLDKKGIDSKLIEMEGHPIFINPTGFWEEHIAFGTVISHYVVKVGDTYIDWSFKQFEAKANHPTIFNKGQLETYWSYIEEV